MARFDDESDARQPKIRPASDPDLYRPRRGGLIFKLIVLCLLLAGAAGAAGYFWWMQRGELEKFESDAKDSGFSAKECNLQLKTVSSKVDGLNQMVATCQTEKQGTIDKHKQVEAMMTSMESNLSATRAELEDLRKQRAEAEKRLQGFKDLTAKFQKMIASGTVQVKFRNGVMLVAMPSEVLFPSAGADLSEPGKMSVMEVGVILKNLPERQFMIVGHTDSQPIKSTVYKDNWELSTARALNVTKFLVSAGLDAKRLIAAGHGEHDPVASNKTKDGREKNRRIEIILLPNINELPPVPSDEEKKEAAGEAQPG
jgi:chemotaxis protein MotB